MKNFLVFLFAVVLLTACSNAHEPVAPIKLPTRQQVNVNPQEPPVNRQEPAAVITDKQGSTPTSRGFTLDGIVAAWSSFTKQSVAPPESATTQPAAMENPIPDAQQSLLPETERIKPIGLVSERELGNSLGNSIDSIDERPGDQVGPRAGDGE